MIGLRRGFVVSLLLLAAVVHAETPPQSAPLSKEAREEVELGVLYYDTGRYAEAATHFEAAYGMSKRAALLFNIARAKAHAGLEEEAISYLQRYVDARPDAADASSVRAEIEARKRALDEAKAKRAAEADALAARRAALELQQKTASAIAVERAQQDEKRRRDLRLLRNTGIGLIATGLALVISGASLGGSAIADANAVSSTPPGTPFQECCAARERQGQLKAAAGISLDVIGLAVSVGGASILGYALARGSK